MISVMICNVNRQLYPFTYVGEIFALSHKLSCTVGATFGETRNLCNFEPPLYKIWGVPDPQFLYPVISFIVPVMMHQKFSMQL